MRYSIASEAMQPSAESMDIIHKSIDKIRPDLDTLNQWYENYSKRQKKRLAFDLDHLQHYVPHESLVLEIGSIPLILTIGMSQLSYKVQGVDISPERFESAIHLNKLDIRKMDIETEKLDFESDQFDVVLFNELFEHLRVNPIHTLGEVHRVLKPNGTLMLSTPNFLACETARRVRSSPEIPAGKPR